MREGSFSVGKDPRISDTASLHAISEEFNWRGRTLAAHVLSLLEDRPLQYSGIVSDEDLKITPEVANSLGGVIVEVHELEESGHAVDCYAFGMRLSGGGIYPTPQEAYQPENVGTAYHADYLAPIRDIDERFLPDMRPLGLGTLTPDGGFIPGHVIVKVTDNKEGSDLYASKLGNSGRVVLSDLKGIAEFYETTHIAPFSSAEAYRKDTGETIFEYHNDHSTEL